MMMMMMMMRKNGTWREVVRWKASSRRRDVLRRTHTRLTSTCLYPNNHWDTPSNLHQTQTSLTHIIISLMAVAYRRDELHTWVDDQNQVHTTFLLLLLVSKFFKSLYSPNIFSFLCCNRPLDHKHRHKDLR